MHIWMTYRRNELDRRWLIRIRWRDNDIEFPETSCAPFSLEAANVRLGQSNNLHRRCWGRLS